MAVFTFDELAERNFLFHAGGGFLERDLKVIAQVRAIVPALAAVAAAEHLLENAATAATALGKDLAKDIKWIVEAAGAARAGGTTLGEGRMTVAVVGGTLVRVFQHLVSLGDFLECLLGFLVAGIFVRVMLDGLLAIGLFQFLLGDVFIDAEQLVIVFLRHGVSRPGRAPKLLVFFLFF